MLHVADSREQFAQSLRHGRGSAMQYVQQHGLAGVADDVLAACLQNQAYDPQCEGSRAPWLYSMFRDTPEYPRFAAAICAALEVERDNHHDLLQLIRLARVMAQAGDQVAAQALRRRFSPQVMQIEDAAWYEGARALIELDGVAMIVRLGRYLGQCLASEETDLPTLDSLLDGFEIADEGESILRQLAADDQAIRRYLVFTDAARECARLQEEVPLERRQQERHARTRRELTLEGILAAAGRAEDQIPGRYMRFGRSATLEELHTVLQCLETESRDEVCLRLLWVFRRTPLPVLTPKVWACVRRSPGKLSDAALTALGQTRHADIACFAREALRGRHLAEEDAALLELFVFNYAAGDAALIHAALQSACTDENTLHAMGHSLLSLCKENPVTEIAPLLVWIYEQTPCTICRYSAVKLMVDQNSLPPSIAEECCEDADEDIRGYGRIILEVVRG
jgi:hypothetical protein